MIPFAILLLRTIKRYYAELDAQLHDERRLDLRHRQPPIVLVMTEVRNRLTNRALQFALQLSPDIIAVHLMKLDSPDLQEQRRLLLRRWSEDVEEPAKKGGFARLHFCSSTPTFEGSRDLCSN